MQIFRESGVDDPPSTQASLSNGQARWVAMGAGSRYSLRWPVRATARGLSKESLILRELLGIALKRPLGAVLLDAPDAELGLELAHSMRPDVILMDINLPGMDGIEAVLALKTDKVTREIPVIAVSAGAMPKDMARGLTAGFFDYLTKPVNLTLLNDALHRALHQAA